MTNTATHEPYGMPVWGTGPGRAGLGGIGEAMDRLPFGKPLWIALMILAFIAWWPLGLAVLFFLIGSGRMGCRGHRARTWAERNGQRNGGPGWSGPWSGWRSFCGEDRAEPTSGNRAFDQYRSDTLRRLEEEQREFAAFLDRLRFAKDKAEFDDFMNQRRQRPESPTEAPPAG
ncbi:MAG TPA: DUF2852 domain-containing protein [Acetobacteraceae bacterium]|nr:DUF2852 domain-containing protein [Acetobacteraceae bacterium]